MKSKQSGGAPIAREEWEFSKVPEDEVVTCYYYEYARERSDIRKVVVQWRDRLKDLDKAYHEANTCKARNARGGHWDETFSSEERATKAFWRELAQLTDMTCAQLLINLPGFPDVPWQKLGNRGQWKHLLDIYSKVEKMRGLRPESLQDLLGAFANGDIRNFASRKDGELAVFRVDWRSGVEKVTADFNKWARKQWNAHSNKKKSRGLHKDHLKQLGVLRLKGAPCNWTWSDIQRHTKEIKGCPLYGDGPEAWRRAKSEAKRRINQIFPIKRLH